MTRFTASLLIAPLLAGLIHAAPERSSNKVTMTTVPRISIPGVEKDVVGTHSDKTTLAKREAEIRCLIPQGGMEPDMDACFDVCEFLNDDNPTIDLPPG
ncbi:hypothetical protein FE257_007915 [Aspergillus nanangensis]|uniref:Uncharacterized protein n=1 Tax=Aspergillus nanangensis TaxID=2582783 RepID=A0AAD4CXN4_ASPNN|nr:hypothetical protein FE257_007915 [Aspergillus nanangensis]